MFSKKSMGWGTRPRTKSRSVKVTTQISLRDFIFPAILTSLVIGVLIGAIRACLLDNLEYARLCANIDYFIQSGGAVTKNHSEAFFETLIKYGKIPVIIWFLAFLPPGALIALILLLVKGMGLGFTTALLTRQYGGQGIFYATILYLPQNLSLIPAYLYVSSKSLGFAVDTMLRQKGASDGKRPAYWAIFGQLFGGDMKANAIIEYAFVLIFSCACAVLAAMLEIYGVPLLIAVFGL